MTKKINLRTCIISRQKLPKESMLRFVITEQQIVIDYNYKIDGRGIYVINQPDIIAKLIKSNFFKKKYNINFNQELYDQLTTSK